jgi:hypothetical protein
LKNKALLESRFLATDWKRPAFVKDSLVAFLLDDLAAFLPDFLIAPAFRPGTTIAQLIQAFRPFAETDGPGPLKAKGLKPSAFRIALLSPA